ncbi:annexin A5-like, partial [Scleropages formosus]
ATRGSVKPFANFNANGDAEVLFKAMKGLGTDEDAILQLLTARSNSQRQQIKAAYKTLHGKDLVDDLKSELGGKFETVIISLMTPPLCYDVTELRNAIKGAGTNEKVLTEILASRTAAQVKEIIDMYKKEYDCSLEDDITGDCSGYFQRMLVILLQASRQHGVDEGSVKTDAEALFAAGEQKFGTDEDRFISILGNRSTVHLKRVFDEYKKLSGYEIEESIQRETSGSLQEVLLAVVKCTRSVPAYFAESLYYAMKGAGTDDQTLVRIMVTRSEVDMLDIRAEFRKMFATSLYSMIKAYRGTVKPYSNFDAKKDAEVLYKAMKGLGTDEKTILELVTARCNAQRQYIKAAYKTLYGKDLVHDLKSELGGQFETVIISLMETPLSYDVTELRKAIKGIGTSENVLIEILASRTPSQVVEMNNAYKQAYDCSLEHSITGDCSGCFQRMLVVLLQASRQQGVDEGKIKSDAEALFAAGEKKFGTDEDQFITILGNRSADHLRRVFDEYKKLSGFEIEESIKRETSGSLRDLFLAVVKCARSVPAYFAECLYKAMKGIGTDEHTLCRIMVSRSEVDMLDIRTEFRKMFATSLYSMIKSETSGDCRKTLLLLCGGDDA